VVLLDTDICIYMLNQRPGFEQILKRLDGCSQGEIIISAITLAELRFGIAASKRRDFNSARLELFLAMFEVVPLVMGRSGDTAAHRRSACTRQINTTEYI